LAQRVTAAWDTWITSPAKYPDTLSLLPDLIIDAENSLTAYDRSPESCRQASKVYQLTRAVLKHAGRVDLLPFVCDRAMHYAEETGDPLLIGAATWYAGQAALSNDMPHAALDIAMLTVEKFERHRQPPRGLPPAAPGASLANSADGREGSRLGRRRPTITTLTLRTKRSCRRPDAATLAVIGHRSAKALTSVEHGDSGCDIDRLVRIINMHHEFDTARFA
jgi:hypothetical protein